MSKEWLYTKHSLGGYIVYEDWDKPICAVNDEEHARMIIAAPEMLEALEELVKIDKAVEMDLLIHGNSYVPEAWFKFRALGLAAIAKAKGETP